MYVLLMIILFNMSVWLNTLKFHPSTNLFNPFLLITIMATLLSDESKNEAILTTSLISLKSDTLTTLSPSKESHTKSKKSQQSNLTQKITSLYTSSDPFKSLYRAE